MTITPPLTKCTLRIATRETPSIWENCPYKGIRHCTNHHKGKEGERIVQEYFESMGSTVTVSHYQGDRYIDDVNSEIKTAVMLNSANGKQVSLWWNQIRPLQAGWRQLFLVGICPEAIYVWHLKRENAIAFSEVATSGCQHSGQGKHISQMSLGVVRNSRTDTFPLLNKYGNLISYTPANRVKVEKDEQTEDVIFHRRSALTAE